MAAFTTLKTHDTYTAQHSLDVAKISIQLTLKHERQFQRLLQSESGASEEFINKNMLEDLALGAMLHDLGKLHVSPDVLNKTGPLNDREWSEITNHPSEGYRELQDFQFDISAPVKTVALQHHEKYDGTGYPEGLSGNDIHVFGRICALGDVYSAITSNRPYRLGLTPPKALAAMADMQTEGPQFDPDIYDKFLSVVLPYPIGQEVELSDGRSGVVSDVNERTPRKPVVRVLHDGQTRLESPDEIALREQEDVYIQDPVPSPTGKLIRPNAG